MEFNHITKFKKENPNLFVLDISQKSELEAYLKTNELINAQASIDTLSSAGEGNMNCVLRVTLLNSTLESFIIKQARPWVEKFPQISAPTERIKVETSFYAEIANHSFLQKSMPKLLHFDEAHHLALFEDLGNIQDLGKIYQDDQQLDLETLNFLLKYLKKLHEVKPLNSIQVFDNFKMRNLNHQHIFDIPLQKENGLNLDEITPGLSDLAEKHFLNNASYIQKTKDLGSIYLNTGASHLIHGDFYPGSWFQSPKGPKVLDPEFCFMGPREFDYGICLAHLYLAQSSDQLIQTYLGECNKVEGLKVALLRQFASVEIMRRLLGYAQLPIPNRLDLKEKLLKTVLSLFK